MLLSQLITCQRLKGIASIATKGQQYTMQNAFPQFCIFVLFCFEHNIKGSVNQLKPVISLNG